MSDDMNIGALLAEQLQRLLAARVDRDALVAVETDGLTDVLWRDIETLGITHALVPEALGGAGLQWREIEPLLRLTGHYAAPVPVAETMLANWALAQAGLEISQQAIAVVGSVLTLHDDDTLSGSDTVVWALQAPLWLAVARRRDEYFLCLLAAQNNSAHALETIGRMPTAAIDIANVSPLTSASLPSNFGSTGLQPFMATLRAAQIAGALTRALELSVDYTNTRKQFGKPIGKFQAIQHQLAELAEHAAATQVGVLFACRQIDAGNADYGAAIAKTYAGKAATRAAAIAHQVFGAIGVTDEHLLHYFTRRLWQWRSENGSEHIWAEQLGGRVLAQSGAALWPLIADNTVDRESAATATLNQTVFHS